MLLCGFEKFDNYFVRIDILERLFMQIINSNAEAETINAAKIELTVKARARATFASAR